MRSGLSNFRGKSRLSGKTKSQKHRSSGVGPFSGDRSLATFDKRTKAGRVLRQTRVDLVEHVSGHPSAAERLIIDSAALKATQLYLLSEKLLAGGDIAPIVITMPSRG